MMCAEEETPARAASEQVRPCPASAQTNVPSALTRPWKQVVNWALSIGAVPVLGPTVDCRNATAELRSVRQFPNEQGSDAQRRSLKGLQMGSNPTSTATKNSRSAGVCFF